MVAKVTKTVLFERAFGVDIRDFQTTEEVDRFIERVRGRKLRVVEIKTPLVEKRGSVYEIADYDIDRMVDDAIGR